MTIKLVSVYEGAGIRAGAIDWLYELMKEREPELNISHRALPTMEQHRAFVNRRPYRCWYLIEGPLANPVHDGHAMEPVWVGYISATNNNEIGIVLRKEFRHRGWGSQAVHELTKTHEPLPAEPSLRRGKWVANVAPQNTASQRMFEKLGGRVIQQTYELP